jgi:hypothetical protein
MNLAGDRTAHARAVGVRPPHTGAVPPPPAPARGLVRLLNTAGGRALCLAGAVDAGAVAAFRARYGGEPARIEVLDARSVTSLSGAALELVRDHLDVAALGGRTVQVHRSPAVDRLFPTD